MHKNQKHEEHSRPCGIVFFPSLHIQTVTLITTILQQTAACIHSQLYVCMIFLKILTRTAFLAAHMSCFPSEVQVLHLTRTSSSFSISFSLTLIVFHSLADDTWNSCIDTKTQKTIKVVEDVSAYVSKIHINTCVKHNKKSY